MTMKAKEPTPESEDSLLMYFKAFTGESDRGKLLLMTAKIDELLYDLLVNFFKVPRKRKEADRLFGPMGPLGSFASRIEMAYRVGLLSEPTANCLDILREIRNDCAHGLERFSLEDVKYSAKFDQFKKLSYTVSGMPKFFELVKRVNDAHDPKSREPIILMLAMIHMLLLQSTRVNLRRVPDNFSDLETLNLTEGPSKLAEPQ